MVLSISKFVKSVDLMFSVLTAHPQNKHKETLDSVGYDHYLDCADDHYHDQGNGCLVMSKLIKLYIINVCCSLHINYTTIQLLKKAKKNLKQLMYNVLWIGIKNG